MSHNYMILIANYSVGTQQIIGVVE